MWAYRSSGPGCGAASGDDRGRCPGAGWSTGGVSPPAVETVNGYFKAELIYGPARPGPWRAVWTDVVGVGLGEDRADRGGDHLD